MDTVYVETTVIGNIAGRLHPDPVICGAPASHAKLVGNRATPLPTLHVPGSAG